MAMTMTGEVQLPASREKVWDKLNDPEVLKACIPGCQTLDRTGENGFSAVVKLKVGPVSATFKGNVELQDLDPPNGYKIAGPTVLARKDPDQLRALLAGHGYEVLEVGGDDVPGMHHRFHETLGQAYASVRRIQDAARSGHPVDQPRWPVYTSSTSRPVAAR